MYTEVDFLYKTWINTRNISHEDNHLSSEMKNNDFEWWNPLGTLLESESAGDTFQMIGDTFKKPGTLLKYSGTLLEYPGTLLKFSGTF